MNLSHILTNANKLLKRHSPEILTAVGVSGVITTAYLAARASYAAAEVLSDTEVPDDRAGRLKEQFKHTWRLYIPAGVSGTLTITSILVATKAKDRRAAAAITAYSLTEKAFSEYKEKVVEQIGTNKEQKLRDEIAQDNVRVQSSREVIIVGGGHVLCYEQYTGRYFRSDKEALDRAVNQINFMILHEPFVALTEFYDLIGLSPTSHSAHVGWDNDRFLELDISAVMTEEEEPCLAFSYNYVKPLE